MVQIKYKTACHTLYTRQLTGTCDCKYFYIIKSFVTVHHY